MVHLSNNENHAFLTTVFKGPAPTPRRVVVDTAKRGLVGDAPVRVSVAGFIPGERVQAMLCAAPFTYGTERCGAPGPVAPFTIDADGTGRIAMVLKGGRVGSDGSSCGRSAACAIVVSYAGSSIPGTALPIKFAAGPSARYSETRLVMGLAGALALLLLGGSISCEPPTGANRRRRTRPISTAPCSWTDAPSRDRLTSGDCSGVDGRLRVAMRRSRRVHVRPCHVAALRAAAARRGARIRTSVMKRTTPAARRHAHWKSALWRSVPAVRPCTVISTKSG